MPTAVCDDATRRVSALPEPDLSVSGRAPRSALPMVRIANPSVARVTQDLPPDCHQQAIAISPWKRVCLSGANGERSLVTVPHIWEVSVYVHPSERLRVRSSAESFGRSTMHSAAARCGFARPGSLARTPGGGALARCAARRVCAWIGLLRCCCWTCWPTSEGWPLIHHRPRLSRPRLPTGPLGRGSRTQITAGPGMIP